LPTYIMLMKFTAPGAEGVKQAAQGRAAGKRAAKALGIKWKQQYLTLGQYDIVTLVEAPDDETMATFALAGAMSGSLHIETMRAFTEAESDKLLKSLPDTSGEPTAE
jgi:uncharacterized protein with GYD domain